MKIRINQDVTFNWKLTVGGESVDLSKLELSVEITTPSNKKVEITPNIQFGTLEFNYRPKQVGEYILSAYLNRFKDGETALDIKAFEGVKYSWNQDFSTDDNLEANYVELAGDFNFGPNVSNVPSVPGGSVDLSDYAKKSYVDTQINGESTARAQADSKLQSKINSKQDTLTAGENIKIENNVISAIDLRPSVDLSDYAKTSYVDTQINNEATSRTQADAELQYKINTKQDKIIAGTGINIIDNTISCTIDTTILKVVNSLPAAPSRGDENKIHLVLSTNSGEGNTYDEYLWANNSWEKIGSFIPSVDLSDYATTSYVDTKASYIDTQINNEATARTQADAELQSKINSKQDKIITGTGIDITDNTISCTLDTTIFKVVNSLPAAPSSGAENKIHLVLSTNPEERNYYDEYLWVNNSWEKIGSFRPSVDLSMYAEKSYVDSQISSETTARTQADAELQSKINSKQDTLTAGENIKIENNVISAIYLMPSVDLSDYAKTSYVDTQINGESTARSQADSELQSKINTKQDKIIAGTGIDITDNTISCTVDTTIFKVVDSLPVAALSGDENKIHLVLSTNPEERNYYDEYLWVNNSWEKIGSFRPSVDLSDYAKKTYVDTQINGESTARTQADSELQSKINKKQDTLTAGENIKIENNVISSISVAKILLNTTWSELKAMRDNSQLVAGQQYRITDYTCTTTQTGTKSAGHVFDIIVTADSESVLNEEARAIQHDEDRYFSNSNLSAWKIWYCIDNDTNRFSWADNVNGKGVIYRMIDEFGNDCPYDVKNIQFYRKWNATKSLWSSMPGDNTGVPCYTFSSAGNESTTSFTDYSLSSSNHVYSNVINRYVIDDDNKQTLNNNCFFGYQCYKNSFRNNCFHNTFGKQCSDNSFGIYCQSNSFGNSCHNNSFGNECESNSFGVWCGNNTFGNYCSNNEFGDDCHLNSFGGSCTSNNFGRSCDYNSFGNECGSNALGDVCRFNSFGNGCVQIKFASDKYATNKYTYYQNNHFGDGCKYIILKGAETASAESQVQNYNVAQGLQGTSNAYLSIDGKRNMAYETKVAKNSNGALKIYCDADSIK